MQLIFELQVLMFSVLQGVQVFLAAMNTLEGSQNLNVAIIGDGGHGASCATFAKELGFTVCGTFVETKYANRNRPIDGDMYWLSLVRDVVHECDSYESHNWVIGIGDGAARERISTRLRESLQNAYFPAIVSRRANVSNTAKVGEGSVIGPGASVGSNSVVGSFSILDISCTLAHDSKLGSFSHLAPGAVVLGNASIESKCFLGANSVVGQKVGLPEGSILGALSFLNKSPSFSVGGVYVGSPAQKIH